MALFDLIFCKKRRGNVNCGAAVSNSSWQDVAVVHEREDKLQDRLDLMEAKLYECDEDSELYDDLQDRKRLWRRPMRTRASAPTEIFF